MNMSRRDALKFSALAGAAIALPFARTVSGKSAFDSRMPQSRLPAPFTVPFSVPPVLNLVRRDATTDYYRITMAPTTLEILPGIQTPVWAYNGTVPGPTIKAKQGRKIVVRQINNLPLQHPTLGYSPWTSVHLHGLASLPEYDGYASDITNPGQFKDYRYPNSQPARTLWYHDHGVHHTATNVGMGLFAQYHLHNSFELGLRIPQGEFDVPLTVSDAMFNSDGTLLLNNNDESGIYGDVILVNGKPWPAMKVKRRKYRFRIVVASPSRSYSWSLSTGDTMAVIGTDAGLVPTPTYVKSFRHGPAERYEIVIDFAKYPVGQRVVLKNTSPKNNINFANTDKVMAFDVIGGSFDSSNNSVPASLDPDQPTMLLAESAAVRERTFDFIRKNGNWTINGKTWDDVVRSNFTSVLANPKFNDVEIWTLRNPSGGWHHPVHIHLIDFKILSRNGKPALPHERGPKDVVYVGENESVRLLMKFDGQVGKYMMHCHNLVHEDHDMMGQFEVSDPGVVGHDPLSNRAKWLPEGPL